MSCLFWIIVYLIPRYLYFNTIILFLNQIITKSFSENHEYHTKSKDTINADPSDFLSAISKVETNLMQKGYHSWKFAGRKQAS